MKKTSHTRRPLKFNKEDFFLIALFVLIFFDIVVHFFHPAYRYYRSVSGSLENKYKQFEQRVVAEFVPTLAFVASNGIVKASSPSVPSSSVSSPSLPSSPTSHTSQSFTTLQLPRGSHFFLSSGVPCVNVSGFIYRLGDMFDGSPILVLNPCFMQTSIARYTFPSDHSFGSTPSFQPKNIEMGVLHES